MIDRQGMPIGRKLTAMFHRISIACVRASALLSLASCASIWGFDDLSGSANSGGSGGEGVIDSGSGAGPTGGGGASTAIKEDGASSPVGSGGAGGGGGSSGNGDVTGGAAGSLAGSGGAVGSGDGGTGGTVGRGDGGSDGGSADGRSAEGGSNNGGPNEGGRNDGAVAADGAGGTGGSLESGVRVDAAGAADAAGQGGGGLADAGICPAVARELLTNGSFEDGEAGWMVSVAGGFPIVYAATGRGGNSPDVVAQSAPNVTWIGGYDRADDSIRQNVVVPANATSITLSYQYAIVTRETGTVQNDVMDVTIMVGAQTIALAHYSNLDAVDAWTRFSAPLPSTLAGQTVTLQFRGTTNGTAISSFYIDTISLQVVACP